MWKTSGSNGLKFVEDSKEYYISLKSRTYDQSVAFCQKKGAELLVMKSDFELYCLMDLISDICSRYITGDDANSFWLAVTNDQNVCGK